MVRKIAITGPESTGKSMLASQLADHYQTRWVPEFARSYLDSLGMPYQEKDLVTIARGQVEAEKRAAVSLADSSGCDHFLFCDTELLVIKIWSEVKYGRCDPWILNRLEEQRMDLYLLCYTDIPWEYDPQREHPEMREQLFNLYYNELNERNLNFRVVSGLGDDRLLNAIKLIDSGFTR